MNHPTTITIAMWLAGCNLESTIAQSVDAPDAPDAPEDCDLSKPFGAPALVGGLNSAADDFFARFSQDQLTVFFTNDLGGPFDLFSSTRGTVQDAFGAPQPLDALNSATGDEDAPTVSADGLTIYFSSTRPGGPGLQDLYVASRPTTAAIFGAPAPVAVINSASSDSGVYVTPDGAALYFNSTRGGAGDNGLFRTSLKAGMFEPAIPIAELNTSGVDEFAPVVTPDELTIFFSRADDIFVARRSTSSDGFGVPTPVAELNTAGRDRPSWVSPDGCTLYFASDRPGGVGVGTLDVYVATRPL